MVIREKALVREMKEAYKRGGYTVLVRENGRTVICCEYWAVEIDNHEVPREALSLMALHMGFLPEPGDAYKIYKGDKTPAVQEEVFEVAAEWVDVLDKAYSLREEKPLPVKKTLLTYSGYNAWQQADTKNVLFIHPEYERILYKIVKQMEENLDKLEKAQAEEARAKAALKKAQDNPDIPEAMMEQLRREAEARAAEEATEEIRKKLATAETALQAAERARTDAEAREKDARDKLAAAGNAEKIANPDLMAINVLGKQILTLWATIKDHKRKAVAADQKNEKAIDAFMDKIRETMANG